MRRDDLMTPQAIRWAHGRAEWRRSLLRHYPSRRDVNELGARAAACLWSEADSPRYWISQRALKSSDARADI